MRKLLKLTLINFILIFSVVVAYANDSNFCCKDNNPQQAQSDAFQTKNNLMNFSFPSGPFRQTCAQCEYDTRDLLCSECKDARGKIAYNSQMTLRNCLHIDNNDRGQLTCGDHDE
jgi:hypothetical protein